jgi:hypothetical protein
MGAVTLRRHAPALALLGDAQDLAEGRRLFRLGCAEAELRILGMANASVNECDDAQALAAAGAEQRSVRAWPGLLIIPPHRAGALTLRPRGHSVKAKRQTHVGGKTRGARASRNKSMKTSMRN